MKLGKFVRLLSVLAPLSVVLVACSEDPTDQGAGDPFAIVTNKSITTLAAGASFTVTAQVVDRAGTPLPDQISVTSAKTDVVVVDSTRFVRELQETRIYGRTLKVDAGAPLVLNVGALTDTVTVKVLSGPFPGTVSTAAFSGGTVIQFTSTTNLFDANTVATVTTSSPGYLVDVTPTRIRYLLPFGLPAGPVTYTITGAGPADFNLSGTFNAAAVPSDDTFEPNNTRATANATALVVGTPVFGSISLSKDPEDYYKFTVTTAGDYVVTLTWNNGSDIDMYLRNSAGANISAFDAATGAKPETVTRTLTPGDYYVQVEAYDDAGGAYSTYQLTVTKK